MNSDLILRSRARFARRLEGWQQAMCQMVRDAHWIAQARCPAALLAKRRSLADAMQRRHATWP